MPLTAAGFNAEMAALVEAAQRNVVQIVGRRGNLGAGTIWRQDGLIVTNAHVVTDRQIEVVAASGTVYGANVIASDDELDLAVVSIEVAGLPTIEPGDSRAVRAGQWVVAIGHPYGVPGSATAGTVISAGKGLPELGGEREWIALNLRLRPGHSGGPLIDVHGRLLGINTLITGPEIGFAIPAHIAEEFVRARVPQVRVVPA